jgi:hypothetical protein
MVYLEEQPREYLCSPDTLELPKFSKQGSEAPAPKLLRFESEDIMNGDITILTTRLHLVH